VSGTTLEELQKRIDTIEESYEFMLAYAAQGLSTDEASRSGAQLRDYLARTEEALAKEREARKVAEAKLGAALASLKEMASVKEESRGLVITLQGSVLFTTGQYELLPIAKEKLNEVVDALAESYANYRVAVIGLIFARPSERITSFADAFRIRKRV
jgi:flagellar motor protein MotB